MPQNTGLQLQAWLGRLGIKNPQAPALADLVTPVFILGDHREQIAPLRGAVGQCGWVRAAFAAQFSCFSITSRAAGGCFATAVLSNALGLRICQWTYGISGPIAVGTNPIVAPADPRFPTSSFVNEGRNAAQVLTANLFALRTTSGAGVEMTISWYLPQNQSVFVESFDANTGISASIELVDIPYAPLT